MVRAKFARVYELRAQEAAARITLAKTHNDYRRRTNAGNTVSQEELLHARDAVTSAEAAISVLRGGLDQALAAVQGTTVADNPDVLSAITHVRQAAIVLGHMHLYAPVDGVVAQRSVQVGQMIAPGTPLMAVVPLEALWIDANFKEGQLGQMRVGQPVAITADVYGSDVTYHGKIAGFGAGSGSAYASGNWIKIVQRVPVRISLDPKELHDHPLRIGLSVAVTADIHESNGPALGVSTGADTDKVIARILAENGA
jgi:membrane fusion protein (multidrug efflux system)